MGLSGQQVSGNGCPMRIPRLGWIGWIVLLTGCASKIPKDVRLPQMNADELARYYDYPRGPIHATVNTKSEKGLWTRAIVEFEMELPPDLHGKEVDEARRQVAATKDPNRAKLMSLEYTVRFDYFRPKSEGK